MKLNIKNETSRLKSVVLGRPNSNGPIPKLEDSYDAKSYQTIKKGIYPEESAIISEMEAFRTVLEKHNVEVLRPDLIENYHQVFARDVAFAIDDKLVISNLIEDRAAEQQAYRNIINDIPWSNIINLPEKAHVEGGDVMIWNDFIFIGTCLSNNYRNYKTARTNPYAIEILKDYFPHYRIIDLDLNKDDRNPTKGILHLDCTFNTVGKDKCIIYKDGFVNESDFNLLVDIFGTENCFEINNSEMVDMVTNVFSIAENIVVSDSSFTRLNDFLRNEWEFIVEEIPYREVAKMGGLLRCSTMPLVRG